MGNAQQPIVARTPERHQLEVESEGVNESYTCSVMYPCIGGLHVMYPCIGDLHVMLKSHVMKPCVGVHVMLCSHVFVVYMLCSNMFVCYMLCSHVLVVYMLCY